MLDDVARRIIDPPLDVLGARASLWGVRADHVTLVGFALGLCAVPLLAAELYGWALGAIAANRFCDGLDGAVARHRGPTDLGGYLDIVCDFIFYSAVPFGFTLARPEHAPCAAFLMLTFMGTGATFLAYATLAAKRGLTTELRGRKSLYYLGGLTEGTETIIALTLFCLLPDWFPALAVLFGAMCILTTITRMLTAWETLRD